MTMKTRALGALAGILAFAAMTTAVADDRPYTEGSVSVVSSIRTEPGQFENYLKYLSVTYKQLMEEAKKAGHVLGYAVYTTMPRSPEEPNLYLVITYKNMAALDGLAERMDAIQQKVVGDQAAQDAAMIARGKMRTQLGSEVIRQIVLK
jgi:hypothetical protein